MVQRPLWFAAACQSVEGNQASQYVPTFAIERQLEATMLWQCTSRRWRRQVWCDGSLVPGFVRVYGA